MPKKSSNNLSKWLKKVKVQTLKNLIILLKKKGTPSIINSSLVFSTIDYLYILCYYSVLYVKKVLSIFEKEVYKRKDAIENFYDEYS